MTIFDRNDVQNIAEMVPNKTLQDVTNYHYMFWRFGESRIVNFNQMIAPIVAKENKEKSSENAVQELDDAFNWKCSQFKNPESQLALHNIRRHGYFTSKHDNFILRSLYKFGRHTPDVCGRIRDEIRYTLLLFINFQVFCNMIFRVYLSFLIFFQFCKHISTRFFHSRSYRA